MSKKNATANNEKKSGGKLVAKAKGWFSARHETDEAHKDAQAKFKTKMRGKAAMALANSRMADSAGPWRQLLELDIRLGVGIGAKKERAKLLSRLTEEEQQEYFANR